ncbi:MAG TPA: helix-turn-helix domain-containing protein, partial [Rubrivivax sp.]|nr:helix-turn-helix domain-containing protein [Rubrivivax sp.]
GNLRELRNAIDYAAAMAGSGGTIGLAELPDSLLAAVPDAPPGPTPPPEAQLLLQYLRAAGWNVTQVAHQLGISRMTVYRRMRRWGIGHERGGSAD